MAWRKRHFVNLTSNLIIDTDTFWCAQHSAHYHIAMPSPSHTKLRFWFETQMERRWLVSLVRMQIGNQTMPENEYDKKEVRDGVGWDWKWRFGWDGKPKNWLSVERMLMDTDKKLIVREMHHFLNWIWELWCACRAPACVCVCVYRHISIASINPVISLSW